jgi:hypothetical protein
MIMNHIERNTINYYSEIKSLTENDYNTLLTTAEKIKENILAAGLYTDCFYNNTCLLNELPKNISSNMLMGVISTETKNFTYYNIKYSYHVVCLFKKEEIWHVIDPIMGIELNILSTSAKEWLPKVFSKECIEYGLTSESIQKGELYKIQLVQGSEVEFEPQILKRMPVKNQQSGSDILNLSEMINVFSGIEKIENIFNNSIGKSAFEKIIEIDTNKIREFFHI